MLGTHQLIITRVFTVTSGVIAYLFAGKIQSLFTLLIVANSIYMPVVVIPFLLAILGFRPRTLSLLLGMGAGVLTALSFECFNLNAFLGIIYSTFPDMLMNLGF